MKYNQGVDMSRVTKVSYLGVWTAELLFVPLGQVPWLYSISQNGWPARSISEIELKNRGYLVRIIFMTMVLSNVPDYLSILLYIKMYLMSKKLVQPEIVVQNQEGFGGIWVGDNVPELEGVAQVPQVHVPNGQQQDKMNTISKLLKWNVVFSLVDLTSIILWDQLNCLGTLAISASFTFQNAISYWIPMLLLAINFKKFRGGLWPCHTHD